MFVKKALNTPIDMKDAFKGYHNEVDIVISVVGLRMKWFEKLLARLVYVKVMAVEVGALRTRTILEHRLHIGDCAHITHNFDLRFDK